MAVAELLTASLAGLLTAGLAGPVLRWLPEPVAGPEDADASDIVTKVPYASLASPSAVAALGVATVAATLGVTVSQPARTWPAWLVLSTLGVVLAMVDGRTTWLPRTLTLLGWVLCVVAAAGGLLLGSSLGDSLRALLGGAAAGAFFGLVWLLSRGGIAFGDVRLAPLVGLAGASSSWSMLLLALLTGTLVACAHGLWRHVTGRRGPFPYAPGLVAGALLAAPLSILVPG